MIQVSNWLATVLDKMVRYHFNERYQSADAVLQDLQDLTVQHPTPPPRQETSTWELLRQAAITGSCGWLLAMLLFSFIGTVWISAAFWLLILGCVIFGVFAKNCSIYRKTWLFIIAFIATGATYFVLPRNFQFWYSNNTSPQILLVGLLLASLIEKYRNAPETRIYLNNARIGTEESRTIAVVIPTPREPTKALEGLRGVAQAQTEINQDGGIDGVPLKVAIANDDDEPKIAEQIASALVKEPHILGVVGHYSSDVTLAAGKVYTSNKLAVISATSTSVDLSNFPDIFRTVPSDASAAKSLARYMGTNLKQQYAAVFYDPISKYSNSLKSEFVKAVRLQGGKVVDEIDLSEPGFSAFNSVKQAIERKAEVLMLAPTPNLLDKALQVVVANGGRLNLLGGDVIYDPKTLDFGSNAVGMVLAMPWDIDNDPKSSFSRQSRKLWGGDVNWLTAMAYDQRRL